MFKLLVFLCAGVFLTLLIGGRDAGQARFGLQGAYDIAALQKAPLETGKTSVAPVVVVAEPAVTQSAPSVASATSSQTMRVTQAAFTPTAEGGAALQAGLTLSLPVVTEADVERPVTAESAPLRVSRVLGSTVNVRQDPSAKSAVVDRLARDEMVTVISSDASGWSMVRIEGDGVEGFIATRYLSDPVDDSALFPSE